MTKFGRALVLRLRGVGYGRAGAGSLGVLQAGAMALGPISHALIGGKPDGKQVLASHSTRKAS